MALIYHVIQKRSEESHKSLLPQSLRFFTSFRITCKDVIGNPLIKQVIHLNEDGINLPCHSEANIYEDVYFCGNERYYIS